MSSSFHSEFYADMIDIDATDDGRASPNIDNEFVIEIKIMPLDPRAWRAIKIVDDFEEDSAKSVCRHKLFYYFT